jgi:hypothetical protein
MEETTLALKSALLVVTMRPTVSALRCFQTNSSGLQSRTRSSNMPHECDFTYGRINTCVPAGEVDRRSGKGTSAIGIPTAF